MEFTRLTVLALFCLAFVGIGASQSAEFYWRPSAEYYWRPSAEDYWRPYAENYWRPSVLPNTPLPKTLSNLNSETNVPIGTKEEKKYSTLFFKHDLYPGKKMSLGFHMHSEIQPSKTSERYSLDFCRSPGAVGEDKYCAPSEESMKNYAISKLGTTKIKVVSSSLAQNQDQYVVEEVKKIGDKVVMCHRLNSEKVVFYCHQVNATTTYMVPLVASDGTKAKAVVVCHHDTRGMNPDVLYQVLKVKPGTVPVCHFIDNKSVVWVPNSHFDDHPCVI